MGGQYFDLLASLPHLGELGSPAPLSTRDLLGLVSDAGGVAEQVEAILLGDDLLLREAVLAGEVADAEPAVLDAEQLSEGKALPAFLAPTGETPAGRAPADLIWEAYFRYVASVARGGEGRLLSAWLGWEVSLRNALATARAKALDLDPQTYLVAADLGETDADVSGVVREWSAAPEPLAGLRVVDGARWEWLAEHEAWFSFSADEIVVYAARLMLMQRWERISRAESAAGVG
jgi:hypothetical protein